MWWTEYLISNARAVANDCKRSRLLYYKDISFETDTTVFLAYSSLTSLCQETKITSSTAAPLLYCTSVQETIIKFSNCSFKATIQSRMLKTVTKLLQGCNSMLQSSIVYNGLYLVAWSWGLLFTNTPYLHIDVEIH